MVGLQSQRNDPIHLLELALADVGENVRRSEIDVAVRLPFVPIRPGTGSVDNRAERLVGVRRSLQRTRSSGVIGPGNLRRGASKYVGQARLIDARKYFRFLVLRSRIDQLHQSAGIGRTAIAADGAYVIFGNKPVRLRPQPRLRRSAKRK